MTKLDRAKKIHEVTMFGGESQQVGHLSCIMRKPAFCICENEGAADLRGNHTADQCLCFCYKDNIPLLPKSKISNL